MEEMDDKWSWLACVSCFWTLLFIQGTVRSAGIFYASMIQQWGINRVEASWPFNICIALEGLGMFMTGITNQKYLFRRWMIIAVLLFALGFALSSLTENIYLLSVFIGLICGVCNGYVFAGTFACLCRCFTRYRNAAIGIAVSGPAVGNLFLPYLHNFLMDTYSLRHSFLLVSGASLQAMVSAMLCRFVILKKSQKRSTEMKEAEIEKLPTSESVAEDSGTPHQGNERFPTKTIFSCISRRMEKKLALLKHPVLHIYTVSFAIVVYASWFWYMTIVDAAKDKGFSQIVAINLIPATAGTGLIGRFAYGWILDFGLIKRNNGTLITIFLMTLPTFLAPHIYNIFVLVALSVVYGLGAGAAACLRGSLPAAYFGVKDMPFALGLNSLLCSAASLLRPWLVGYMRDSLESYDAAFYIHGALTGFAGMLWFLEPIAMKTYKREQEAQNSDRGI